MGLGHSPRIVTDGLVLAFDAANQKSINLPSSSDHGWADWYCMVTGTAVYSIVDSGISIYQRTSAGVVTTMVGPSTGPSRGTFTVTAGNTYYGDGPINLVVEDVHHALVPTTLAGTLFWHNGARVGAGSQNFYVYAPFGPTQIRVYDATTNGIYSPASNVINLTQGSAAVLTAANVGGVNSHSWLTSNVPIIATVTMVGFDRTILTPMSQYVYNRYFGWTNNEANSATILSNNGYTVYSSNSSQKVMNMTLADGAGGDSAQGLGLEHLSDTYSWGNYLSDYIIAAPYSPTTVSVKHWNGSVWTTLETHTLTGGTIQNAVGVFREGTANVGNTGTIVSGLASYFNNSQLWKWESDKPFYVGINDNADDEFSVLGWNQSSYARKPRSSNIVSNLVGSQINGSIINGMSVSNNTFYFDGIKDYLLATSNPTFTDKMTASMWINPSSVSGTIWMFGREGNYRLLITSSLISWVCATVNNGWYTTGTVVNTNTGLAINNWHNVVCTYDGTNLKIYINGILNNTGSAISGNILSNGLNFNIGKADAAGVINFVGLMSNFSLYNRALTGIEIQQNFNALRGRFGI